MACRGRYERSGRAHSLNRPIEKTVGGKSDRLLVVLNRLLSTPSRDDAVTDPSSPLIANSPDETFTRLITAFTDAHLSLYTSSI